MANDAEDFCEHGVGPNEGPCTKCTEDEDKAKLIKGVAVAMIHAADKFFKEQNRDAELPIMLTALKVSKAVS